MFWEALLIITPTFFLVKKTVDYFFPGKCRTITMKTSWYTIELCSKIEIYISETYNRYIPTLFASNPEARIKLIGDGDEIQNYSFHEFMKYKKNGMIKAQYDFLLYEIPIQKKDKYHKYDKYIFRYENSNDIINVIECNSLKSFELNMIQMTINNSDVIYTIDFGRNQYILNGNVLFDRPFLKWYLNVHCNVILQDSDKYVVSFIDHNMNYVNLPDYCYLLIKKNNYDIVNIVNDN